MSFDWDKAYRTGEYRKHWDCSAASQEIATCVALGVFPRKGVLLDIGCGSGSDAIFLASSGFHVKALDISSVALDLVRERAAKAKVKVETIHGSATKMPVEESSIDFALDRGLLHNLSDDEGRAYALELARILKPGAGFLLRGARISYNGNFNPITPARIRATFPPRSFSASPPVPIQMVSDASKDPSLDGAIVMIRCK
jgi:ubiquinone/menaquinone biosynthesis C-methylase UbiE